MDNTAKNIIEMANNIIDENKRLKEEIKVLSEGHTSDSETLDNAIRYLGICKEQLGKTTEVIDLSDIGSTVNEVRLSLSREHITNFHSVYGVSLNTIKSIEKADISSRNNTMYNFFDKAGYKLSFILEKKC